MDIRLDKLSKPGQINEGDILIIADGNGVIHSERAKIIVRPGVKCDCNGEEIILRKKKNIYFITDLFLKGKSWVKECYVVRHKD